MSNYDQAIAVPSREIDVHHLVSFFNCQCAPLLHAVFSPMRVPVLLQSEECFMIAGERLTKGVFG